MHTKQNDMSSINIFTAKNWRRLGLGCDYAGSHGCVGGGDGRGDLVSAAASGWAAVRTHSCRAHDCPNPQSPSHRCRSRQSGVLSGKCSTL